MIPTPHPVRRRLWQVAFVLGAILGSLIYCDVNGRIALHTHKISLGQDLLPSYIAGELVRVGRPAQMYNRDAVITIEERVIREADLDMDKRFGPWLNPPFFAWVFVPLSALPYRNAATVFLIINILLFFGSVMLLTRWVAEASRETTLAARADWRTYALVPFWIFLAHPLWQAMGHQQNTFISLLLLTCAIACCRRGNALAAGLIGGLLFFKPQLAALIAAAMLVVSGWRVLLGYAITGTALLAITLITLPGCITAMFHFVPGILHWLQIEMHYNWGRQVTFQSFWRLILQGHVNGETSRMVKVLWWLCSGAIGIGMLAAVRGYFRGPRDAIARDRLIAAAVVSMPMLMPYYMDYDLLLMAVPAVLLAAEWVRRPAGHRPADYWLMGVWGVFCVVSHVNPGLGSHTRLNADVLLLATLSSLYISRCLRPAVQSAPAYSPARRATLSDGAGSISPIKAPAAIDCLSPC